MTAEDALVLLENAVQQVEREAISQCANGFASHHNLFESVRNIRVAIVELRAELERRDPR